MTWLTRKIRIEVPTLTDQEKRGALAVPESTPLWAAIIVRAPQTAQQPPLLAHTAGGLDALASLKEDLAAKRADALASPQAL